MTREQRCENYFWFKSNPLPLPANEVYLDLRGRKLTGDELADHDDEFSLDTLRYEEMN